tara:strand:- start:10087 stop:10575 length:489 start_codon:yes stop_codon:yes gene_type:complete
MAAVAAILARAITRGHDHTLARRLELDGRQVFERRYPLLTHAWFGAINKSVRETSLPWKLTPGGSGGVSSRKRIDRLLLRIPPMPILSRQIGLYVTPCGMRLMRRRIKRIAAAFASRLGPVYQAQRKIPFRAMPRRTTDTQLRRKRRHGKEILPTRDRRGDV